MNIEYGIIFLVYGFVMSFILANVLGKIIIRNRIRLHHGFFGFIMSIFNGILCLFFILINITIAYVMFDLFFLSLGVMLSDIKDIKKW